MELCVHQQTARQQAGAGTSSAAADLLRRSMLCVFVLRGLFRARSGETESQSQK